MQNNIISKISPTVRIICLFILSISLFLARSVFLILLITTLTLILMVTTGRKVNLYVNTLKKIYILLLFLLIVYIIMFEYNIFNILIFTYKLIIVALLFVIFCFNTNFNQLHQSIYGCLKPLKKLNFDIEQLSFDIVLALKFLKILINQKDCVLKKQVTYGKKQLNLKNYIMPIFINSVNEFNELQYDLKTKFYKLSYSSSNIFSKIILILFLILFIVVVFKEVIL